MKTLANAILFSLLSLVACKKKESAEPLPSGKNTYSCQIDGQEFTPHLPPVILSTNRALEARRTDRSTGFFLQAKDSFNELAIYFSATQGVGTYPLGFARSPIPYPSNPNSYGYYQKNVPLPPGGDPYNPPRPLRYYTDMTNTGTVTVTRFDTVARIAGGTFEYTAREAATGQLVRVTNGKFDVTF